MNPDVWLSKRQVLLQLGMNANHFDHLVAEQVLSVCWNESKTRCWVKESSLSSLLEGEHYVLCRSCGAKQSEISPKHLMFCSKMTLPQYLTLYPQASSQSVLSRTHRQRSEDVKKSQSIKMLRYFQSDEGQALKQTLSESYEITPARSHAISEMVTRNKGEKFRKLISRQSSERWSDPQFREKRKARLSHIDLPASIAHARTFLTKSLSQPHRRLKEALIARGLGNFTSEYALGRYRLDEAWVTEKLAIEVQGCYWHNCPTCAGGKSLLNVTRDSEKQSYLTKEGWRLFLVWEHEIKDDLNKCVDNVVAWAGGADVGSR